jgi:MoaA/NifB/PqqE/SkfB family radical SAM enzyme
LMTEETIDAALRFAPYAADGAFWYSCLHEPTMHPRFIEYLRKMSPVQRRTIFYTSNFARRMPSEYYEFLADSGIHHINISIESLDPAIYERMRKGARHRIFKENWDILLNALRAGKAPPKLRYITMAYKSNLREIPALVEHLLTERDGAEIEVRYTYNEPHIPADFARAEYLDEDEWLWLRDQLAHRLDRTVMLSMPPGVGESKAPAAETVEAPAGPPSSSDPDFIPPGFLPGRYGFRLTWDGTMEVRRVWGGSGPPIPGEVLLKTLNVRDAGDPEAFLASLPI